MKKKPVLIIVTPQEEIVKPRQSLIFNNSIFFKAFIKKCENKMFPITS